MGDMSQYGGMLGAGMPTTPEELQMMRAAQMAREMPNGMSAGQAMPYQTDMFGRVAPGGFSPRDLFGMAGGAMRAPMIGAGLLGRGMMAADPAERMFGSGLWSILRGL